MKKSVLALLAATALLAALPAQATKQAQERRDARDVRQDTRQESRDAKQACREGVVGNADCRQEHRDNKQEGRARPGISNIDAGPSEDGLHRVSRKGQGAFCPLPIFAMRASHSGASLG